MASQICNIKGNVDIETALNGDLAVRAIHKNMVQFNQYKEN